MRSRHNSPLGVVGTALRAVSGPTSAQLCTPDLGTHGPVSRVRVTGKGDAETRPLEAVSGLSTARMAAVVPAGLALVVGLPLLVEAGAELGSHLSGWGADALALALVVGMALVWRAVLGREVARG
jgi:hypothetical protein